MHSEIVPICSTVSDWSPSMPTQKLEAEYSPDEHETVGTSHDPATSLTDPRVLDIAYPLQFKLEIFDTNTSELLVREIESAEMPAIDRAKRSK